MYGTSRRMEFIKRDFLALEFFGPPPLSDCIVCGNGPPYRVVHLDGNRYNCARDNLKYVFDYLAARRHELKCLKWAMESNEVPPYRKTVSKRVLAQRAQEKKWEKLGKGIAIVRGKPRSDSIQSVDEALPDRVGESGG
jgi:hypothetical protein